MTNRQHKYYRKALLYSIAEFLGVPPKDREKAARKIHLAIKETFEIDSFSSLGVSEFEKIASILRLIFNREYGWIIPEADEEGIDVQNMSMSDFLKIKMQ